MTMTNIRRMTLMLTRSTFMIRTPDNDVGTDQIVINNYTERTTTAFYFNQAVPVDSKHVPIHCKAHDVPSMSTSFTLHNCHKRNLQQQLLL